MVVMVVGVGFGKPHDKCLRGQICGCQRRRCHVLPLVLVHAAYNLRAIISPDAAISASEPWDEEKRGEGPEEARCALASLLNLHRRLNRRQTG